MASNEAVTRRSSEVSFPKRAMGAAKSIMSMPWYYFAVTVAAGILYGVSIWSLEATSTIDWMNALTLGFATTMTFATMLTVDDDAPDALVSYLFSMTPLCIFFAYCAVRHILLLSS